MKKTLQSRLAALSFAILSTITFSGCASSSGAATSGTHEMGPPKSPSRMSNHYMPGR